MKVLFVTNLINTGGVAKVVLSYIEGCFSKDPAFSCDVAAYEEPNEDISSRLKTYGVNVYKLPRPTRHIFKYRRELNSILADGLYDAVHTHIEYFNWIPCKLAKQQNVKFTVAHAHGQKGNKENLIHHTIQKIGRLQNSKYCDVKIACSDPSGKFVFGKDFSFLPNFVDAENIKPITADIIQKYNDEFSIKKDLNIVFGYMGYIGLQKNPKLAIDFINEYHRSNPNAVLLMAGEGIEKSELERYVSDNRMDSFVQFIGQRADNIPLMQYFDCLVMPSFSEGMSIALIEAQISGTPCLVSPGVPQNNDLGMGLYFQAKELSVDSFLYAYDEMKKNKKNTTYSERLNILKENRTDKEGVILKLLAIYRGECINDGKK